MFRKAMIAATAIATLLLGLVHHDAEARKKAEGPARPALWMLSDADTTIYLFGTIHLLPKGLAWRGPKLEAAIARSDSLVLEVGDLDDQAKTAGAMLAVAMSPNLPPVAERVPAEKRPALEALAKKAGIPLAMLDRFENWAVALTLAVGALKDIGLSPDEGVEEQLRRSFVAQKKPISGLETAEQQFGFFDSMSPKAQETLLLSTIDDGGDARVEFEKMISAWKRGDEKAIALSFDDEVKLSPELMDVLLRKRNANWATWLDDRMDQPGTIFLAVGAGHLAGPDSVQAMLQARGFKVKRVQ